MWIYQSKKQINNSKKRKKKQLATNLIVEGLVQSNIPLEKIVQLINKAALRGHEFKKETI
jgi:hypothetical protein